MSKRALVNETQKHNKYGNKIMANVCSDKRGNGELE